MTDRLHRARQRLAAMVADPFGRQVLRDLVPEGKRITVALAEESIEAAVSRAVHDCGGTPAYLAVDESDRDTLTLLIAEQAADGRIVLRRPGDWRAVPATVGAADPLGDLIAALRAAHD